MEKDVQLKEITKRQPFFRRDSVSISGETIRWTECIHEKVYRNIAKNRREDGFKTSRRRDTARF